MTTINVDLDGVIYPFVETLGQYARRKGYNIPTAEDQSRVKWYDSVRYTRWEVWHDWGMSKGLFRRIWRDGIEDDLYLQGIPIAGARESLWYLSDLGFHIRIITDRLNHFSMHRRVVQDTAEWLDLHQIPYRSLAFDWDKTHDAPVMVDDKPENVNRAAKAGMLAYLYAAPHNQTAELHSEARRAKSWESLVNQIT